MSPCLLPRTHHPCVFLLVFAIVSSTLSPSSPIELPYTDHCGSVVPESNPTEPLPIASDFHLAGYHSGGAPLFEAARLPLPRSFFFSLGNVSATRTPGVLKVDGGIALRGNRLSVVHRDLAGFRSLLHQSLPQPPTSSLRGEMVVFGLSGFYSTTSGKLCMVGHGYGPDEGGKNLKLSAFLKLNFPYTSNIYSSVATGILEISDASNSSHHFDPFSMLAYGQLNYEYTLVPEIKQSCSRIEVAEDSPGLELNDFCRFLLDFEEQQFVLEYMSGCWNRKCGPFGRNFQFVVMKGMNCSLDGRLRMYLEFSHSGLSDFLAPLLPEATLVAEGLWDSKRNQLRLMACRILYVGESVDRASIGDCTIGFSLWFPASLSVRSAKPAIGRIWSNRDEADPGFFHMIKLWNLDFGYRLYPGIRYEYTEMDAVRSLCLENISRDSEDRRSQDVKSFRIDEYHMTLVNSLGESAWVRVTPVALGEVFKNNLEMGSMQLVETNQSMNIWNVSYEISYMFRYWSSDESRQTYMVAEGLYNTENGVFCMVGCRYLGSSAAEEWIKDADPMDCKILINIQLLTTKRGSRRLDGTITSTREKTDPLYFEDLKISSSATRSARVDASIWRLNMRVTVVMISFMLSCVSIGLQLSYVKKQPEVLNSVSLTMLILLNFGNLMRILLSFEALSFMRFRGQNILLRSFGWFENAFIFFFRDKWYDSVLLSIGWVGLNETLLLVTLVLVLRLGFRLLHTVRHARSRDQGMDRWAAKWNMLRASFPHYFLIALFLYSVYYGTLLHHSLRENVLSPTRLMIDGFLLPQIIRNLFLNSCGRALTPAFYVGLTAARALPHVYDAYRPCRYSPFVRLSSKHETSDWDFTTSPWDLISPCIGFIFASVICLQQRFGGRCLLPARFRKTKTYENVPVVSL